eukprot:TRINITY_DN10829_c0_g1_i1.p1 TRINITY_DN10829_c0_g1~~TRINITY_DN10829_c0_g1_i1.p1  ORF type:complete len:280 (-),score=80.31 TRINITY_DN10829_c0_g1_i1:29-868(-)
MFRLPSQARFSNGQIHIKTRTFTTSPNDVVTVTKKDSYGILSLNRPKANAIDSNVLSSLRSGLKELEADNSIRGVIIASTIPKIFSAGLDLPFLSTLDRAQMGEWFLTFNHTLKEINASRLVSVTAINGHSPAGGTVIALATDYRIMAKGEQYKMGLNEVAVSLVMPSGIISMFERAVGPRNAELYGLTGRLMGPDEALKINLVDKVVEEERVLPEAEEYMQNWLKSVTRAVEGTRYYFKKPILEAFDTQIADKDKFLDAWFHPESQKFFANFKKNLKK